MKPDTGTTRKIPCACGNPMRAIGNKTGRCKPCSVSATQAANTKPLPADFSELAGNFTNAQAIQHWGEEIWIIGRWRRETGIRAAGLRNGTAVPEDFAELAARMTIPQLGAHYSRARGTIRRWCEAAEVTPIDGRTLVVARPRLVTGNADRMFSGPRVMTRRDDSRVGRAVDFLRRFGPVVRCDADGRYSETGSHYRRGSTVLTGAEIIERAERNGWDADAWRRVA